MVLPSDFPISCPSQKDIPRNGFLPGWLELVKDQQTVLAADGGEAFEGGEDADPRRSSKDRMRLVDFEGLAFPGGVGPGPRVVGPDLAGEESGWLGEVQFAVFFLKPGGVGGGGVTLWLGD
jgi:hypothetical protein